jgi:hypothetical protein
MISQNGRTLIHDKDRKLRRWVYLAVLVGLLEVPYLIWPWLAPYFRPREFTSHKEQIVAILQEKGIAFDNIYLEQGWPDRINHQTYGANVIVHVSGSNPISGRIECRVEKRRCWFHVAKLGIRRQELADVVTTAARAAPEPSWSERIESVLAKLGTAN